MKSSSQTVIGLRRRPHRPAGLARDPLRSRLSSLLAGPSRRGRLSRGWRLWLGQRRECGRASAGASLPVRRRLCATRRDALPQYARVRDAHRARNHRSDLDAGDRTQGTRARCSVARSKCACRRCWLCWEHCTLLPFFLRWHVQGETPLFAADLARKVADGRLAPPSGDNGGMRPRWKNRVARRESCWWASLAYLFAVARARGARSWLAPTPPGYVGAHAPNSRLCGSAHHRHRRRVRPRAHRDRSGRQALRGDDERHAAAHGSRRREHRDVFANTGGRVLGFDFDAQGRMIAADAMKGLLAITTDGSRERADRPRERPTIRSVMPTPSSWRATAPSISLTRPTRFAPVEWGGTYEASVLDILEQAATGRVLAFDPATGLTRSRGAWILVCQRHRIVCR